MGPKFITIDEFNDYWTVNLRDMLRTRTAQKARRSSITKRCDDRMAPTRVGAFIFDA